MVPAQWNSQLSTTNKCNIPWPLMTKFCNKIVVFSSPCSKESHILRLLQSVSTVKTQQQYRGNQGSNIFSDQVKLDDYSESFYDLSNSMTFHDLPSFQVCSTTTTTATANATATATTTTSTTILRPSGFCLGLPTWAGTRKVKPGS